MRIIKNRNIKYESFYKSLAPQNKPSLGNDLYFTYLQGLSSAGSFTELVNITRNFIGSYLPALSLAVYQNHLESTEWESVEYVSEKAEIFFRNALSGGIIEWVQEEKNFIIIPDPAALNVKGSSSSYLIYSHKENKNNYIVLADITGRNTLDENSARNIEFLLRIFLSKVFKLNVEKKMSSLLNELNLYQSKLSNDFRYSAIGELTSGIIEEIVNPLQVILSYTDMLEKEDKDSGTGIPGSIKVQINKVEQMINRLTRFVNIDNGKIKLVPCSLSKVLEEYYNIVNSSLKNEKIESVVDLDPSLPLILSNAVLLNQLFANVFSLIKKDCSEGGILIQSRSDSKNVYVKFIFTGIIEVSELSVIPEMKIIENIMTKHEGKVLFQSKLNLGTSLVLSFPVKRKMR